MRAYTRGGRRPWPPERILILVNESEQNDLIAGIAQPVSRRRALTMGAFGVAGLSSILAACGSKKAAAPETTAAAAETTAAATETTAAATETTAAGGLDSAKVAFVYVGPPDDNGWSEAHDLARQAAEAKFNGKIKSTFTPNIGFDASTTQLFEQLVADGNNMVIANTEYGELMSTVTDKNPKVKFIECDGHKFTSNLFGYYMAHADTAYQLGIAAGLLAPSGKIGYIGAFPTATLYNDVNGLLLGARSVNPNATVNVVLVNTFFDPQKAAQAADALLSEGVEFLFGVMDEPTFLQKAEAKGVWTGYWNLDFREAAPTKYVNNFDLTGFGPFYEDQFSKLLAGTWAAETQSVLLDCPLGTWGPNVPQNVQDAVAAAAAKLKDGSLAVYTGPLKDTKGAEVVAAGKTIDRQGSYAVNFAVEGVTGL